MIVVYCESHVDGEVLETIENSMKRLGCRDFQRRDKEHTIIAKAVDKQHASDVGQALEKQLMSGIIRDIKWEEDL